MLESLKKLLKKHEIDASIAWNTDTPTRSGSQWFIGKHWKMGEKDFYSATFGDFKRNLKESWDSEGDYTPEEKALAEIKRSEIIKEESEAREKVHLETAVELEKEFSTFSTDLSTPYLRRKHLSSLFGARVKPNEHGDPILCVPLIDTNGKFWNFQRIYAQKLSKGDKFFADGARIEGCFHLMGDKLPREAPQTIYLCEGFATAASVKLAFPDVLVVAAFNANNLHPVAVALKEKYPSSAIIVCADNDAYTVIQNKHVNVGLIKGRKAAGAVQGELRWPVFKYPQKTLTDFNDLHCAEGIDRVKDQILNFGKYVQGIQPMCLDSTKSGKTIQPSEKQVSDYILKEFDGRLVKQEKAIFFYSGSHWEELGPAGIDRLKQWIGVAANGMLGSRDLRNYLDYLLVHTPSVPKHVDMFQPNAFAANFQDGTLHLRKEKGNKFRLEFLPHDRLDFLTNTLPFKFPGLLTKEELPPAPKFDAVVERLWANNSDRDECLRFAYQTVGASLMPAFPLIVFFWGKPNSGKSTWIKLLVKLIGFENVCSVQPADFFGFNMESMVGKLVNYDTDIDVNRPMNDSEVKKLIDRTPRRVRRKNRMDAYAHLPSVHLFAANSLPRSLDGSSHAYGRRLICVHTESFSPGSERVMDFEEVLLEDETEAIVARGLVGLQELVNQNGQFTVPQGSREAVHELEMASDVIGQFLQDVSEGEVRDKNNRILLSTDARIERPNLWEVFSHWQDDSLGKSDLSLGKHAFFSSLEKRGFKLVKVNGERFFRGIGAMSQPDSIA